MNFAVGTKSSKHYSRETFQIRREVLEKGYYSHILNEVVQLIKALAALIQYLILAAVKDIIQSR